MKRSRAITVIIILIVAAGCVAFLLQVYKPRLERIVITSNADFEDQGWSGSGTESDPYVLAGYELSNYYLEWEGSTSYTHAGEAAVIINDTTAHFVISDCVFVGSVAIKLNNVRNGVIDSCSVGASGMTEHFEFAVQGYNLSNCNITNNMIGNCADYAIKLENGDNNAVTENTVFFYNPNTWRGDVGISLINQTLLKCRYNTIRNYTTGIEMDYCSGSVNFHWISENLVEECDYGMQLWECADLSIYQNEFKNNAKGIDIYNGSAVLVGNNSVSSNTNGGVWVRGWSIDCLLFNNEITNNDRAGIIFDYIQNTTHPCQAGLNEIKNNNGWGIIVNGGNETVLVSNIFEGNTLGDIGYNISVYPNSELTLCSSQHSDFMMNDYVSFECISLIKIEL